MLVAIAYRWGQINNHNYLITATTGNAVSKNVNPKIYKDAENVWKNRGGKYGISIWFVSEPGKPYKREVLKHFPSSCKENKPYESEHPIDLEKFKNNIQDEISRCDAQEIVERNAKNLVVESFWSGNKSGLRRAFLYLKEQIEE